ncbi:hypothetical protein CTAYLR_007236 [Chrysophaeum taylorii]|uniref:PH domain-containing protein n=1 Tax=Chrysophaeum taylorii TaxID=2483200 RepID=A0AAD7UCS3_9STRA|nr:hypothetical protein CTAYLR_007236 [Chrysophaeum taylorii]
MFKSTKEKKRSARREMVVKSDFRPSATWERRSSFSPAKVGFLEKKATGLGGFQRRYFVASGHYLRYFSGADCKELLAAIDVGPVRFEVRGRRGFALCLGSERFVARAATEADRDTWLATLALMRKRARAEMPDSESDISKNGLTTNVDAMRESMTAMPGENSPAAASGALYKWSDRACTWKTRFCVACGHYLRYYHSDQVGAPLLGVIDLDKARVDASDLSKEFSLVLSDQSAIRFMAADVDAKQQWVATLFEIQNLIGLSAKDVPKRPMPPRDDSRDQDTDTTTRTHPSLSFSGLHAQLVDLLDDDDDLHSDHNDDDNSASDDDSTNAALLEDDRPFLGRRPPPPRRRYPSPTPPPPKPCCLSLCPSVVSAAG